MKRILLILIVVFSIILVSNVNADPPLQGSYFIGLWQGIDPNDGSESLRSIVKNDEGTFDIIGTETYFSACGGYPGVIEGTGELEDGVILCTFNIRCLGGSTFTGSQEYVPDRRNNTLLEVSDSGYPTIILHRISR